MVDAVGAGSTTTHTAEQVIALESERLNVSKKRVVTGEVEVSTITRLHDALVDEALTSQHVTVERVAIDRVIDAAPEVREEDGVLIVPVIEEIVVVERRLVLKEEIRIHRSTSTQRHRETVTLRQQEAVIQRKPAAATTE